MSEPQYRSLNGGIRELQPDGSYKYLTTTEARKRLNEQHSRIAQLEAAQPTEEQIEAEITPEVFTAGRMAFQANARNSGGQKIRAVYKAMRLKSLQLTEGEE